MENRIFVRKCLLEFGPDQLARTLSDFLSHSGEHFTSPASHAVFTGFQELRDKCDSPLSDDVYYRAISYIALDCMESLHEMLVGLLVRMVNDLTPHLQYFERRLSTPVRYFFESGPRHWMVMNRISMKNSLLGAYVRANTTFYGYFQFIKCEQALQIEEKIDHILEFRRQLLIRAGQLHRNLFLLLKV
eukprot:726183_1